MTDRESAKPQDFDERIGRENIRRFPGFGNRQQMIRLRSAFAQGAEWGAREVLSAPVSDAVLKAYYDARTVPGCDECEQRERAGVAQGLRPCERHRIAAAIKAIAAEMGVEL